MLFNLKKLITVLALVIVIMLTGCVTDNPQPTNSKVIIVTNAVNFPTLIYSEE